MVKIFLCILLFNFVYAKDPCLQEISETLVLKMGSQFLNSDDFGVSSIRRNTRVAMQIRSRDLLNIAQHGFRNQHQVGRSQGYYNPQSRKLSEVTFASIGALGEQDLIGIPKDLLPKYGFLTHGNFREEESVLNPDLSQYGDVTVVFRSEIESRTSYSVGDSFHAGAEVYSAESAQRPLNTLDASNFNPIGGFIEAQIWGGLGLKDIEKIYIPKSANPAVRTVFVELSKRFGFKVINPANNRVYSTSAISIEGLCSSDPVDFSPFEELLIAIASELPESSPRSMTNETREFLVKLLRNPLIDDVIRDQAAACLSEPKVEYSDEVKRNFFKMKVSKISSFEDLVLLFNNPSYWNTSEKKEERNEILLRIMNEKKFRPEPNVVEIYNLLSPVIKDPGMSSNSIAELINGIQGIMVTKYKHKEKFVLIKNIFESLKNDISYVENEGKYNEIFKKIIEDNKSDTETENRFAGMESKDIIFFLKELKITSDLSLHNELYHSLKMNSEVKPINIIDLQSYIRADSFGSFMTEERLAEFILLLPKVDSRNLNFVNFMNATFSMTKDHPDMRNFNNLLNSVFDNFSDSNEMLNFFLPTAGEGEMAAIMEGAEEKNMKKEVSDALELIFKKYCIDKNQISQTDDFQNENCQEIRNEFFNQFNHDLGNSDQN